MALTYAQTMLIIKGCPYCRSDYLAIHAIPLLPDRCRSYPNTYLYHIVCNACKAQGPPCDTVTKAIKYWNDRTH